VLAATVQIIIVEILLYFAADLNVPMTMNAHTTWLVAVSTVRIHAVVDQEHYAQ
jgi:hypothetical protein